MLKDLVSRRLSAVPDTSLCVNAAQDPEVTQYRPPHSCVSCLNLWAKELCDGIIPNCHFKLLRFGVDYYIAINNIESGKLRNHKKWKSIQISPSKNIFMIRI